MNFWVEIAMITTSVLAVSFVALEAINKWFNRRWDAKLAAEGRRPR